VSLRRAGPQRAGRSRCRLPTEAEWEYAAGAGTETAFYNGAITITHCADPTLDEIGWYCGNSEVSYGSGFDCSYFGGGGPSSCDPQPVGGKQPNVWGLADMAGNVWEWGWDWYGGFSTAPVSDPSVRSRESAESCVAAVGTPTPSSAGPPSGTSPPPRRSAC